MIIFFTEIVCPIQLRPPLCHKIHFRQRPSPDPTESRTSRWPPLLPSPRLQQRPTHSHGPGADFKVQPRRVRYTMRLIHRQYVGPRHVRLPLHAGAYGWATARAGGDDPPLGQGAAADQSPSRPVDHQFHPDHHGGLFHAAAKSFAAPEPTEAGSGEKAGSALTRTIWRRSCCSFSNFTPRSTTKIMPFLWLRAWLTRSRNLAFCTLRIRWKLSWIICK